MSKVRPVVAVDVDGVLNALTSKVRTGRELHHVAMPSEEVSPFANPATVGEVLPLVLNELDGKFLTACGNLGAEVVWGGFSEHAHRSPSRHGSVERFAYFRLSRFVVHVGGETAGYCERVP